MNSQPLVSIVLPTYNGSRYLRESIESCIAQTYARWELIIVDDKSTDSTPTIAEEYARRDTRIRVIRHKVNRKLPGALNTGFRATKGDLLTWTSDDNAYEPEALEVMIGHLTAHADVDFVNCDVKLIDEHGNFLKLRNLQPPAHPHDVACLGACFLYRRHVYEALGDYAEDMFLAEDFEYWLRARNRYRVDFLADKSPYRYREHGAALSSRKAEVQLQIARARAKHTSDQRAAKRILEEGLQVASWHFRQGGNYKRALACAARAVATNPISYRSWRTLVASIVAGCAQAITGSFNGSRERTAVSVSEV